MVEEDPLKPQDTCSICSSEYDEDAGGIQGYFGILPVTFCEWCYSSIYDMIAQDIKRNEEYE
tara:strand:- start:8620 stop:8805 length:186 start_codon:yes stop_codon:yes gene_type:complete